MESEELSKFSSYALKEEIKRREEKQAKEDKSKQEKKMLEEWKNRPRALFVGRAYGFKDQLVDIHLYSVSVAGNCPKTYPSSWNGYKIPNSLQDHFANYWGSARENEFANALSAVVQYYMAKFSEEPDFIAKLIIASRNIPWDSTIKKEIEEEWHKAAIERLCEFPTTKLVEAISKAKKQRNFDNAKEKIELLGEAVRFKKEHSIPDQTGDLPEEIKEAVMLGKLK